MANLLNKLSRPSQRANQPIVGANPDFQLQQAVAAAPPSSNITGLAQQLGAGLAALQNQKAVQQQTLLDQQRLTTQKQQLAVQQEQERQRASGLAAGLKAQQIDNVAKLAAVSQEAKKELFDKRLQFSSDELGRKFSNELQFSDWVRLNARNEQEFLDYQQEVTVAHDRNSKLMEAAFNKIQETLIASQAKAQEMKDQVNQIGITAAEQLKHREILETELADQLVYKNALANLKIDLDVEAAKVKNNQIRNQAIGGVIGAVAGAGLGTLAGNPLAGAMLGQKAGEGLGSLASAF